ncbi:MAG: DNA gyrase/topoisomerase IV subunit A [Bacteroidales bacterium]|jgi:topoisomerase-4 subunit A|nr:DNA gyrase/topoisomerase IV subunit A [Bacteroidales bacterium]
MEESENITNQEPIEENLADNDLQKILHIKSMFEDWFLDYASYVNLDRAVPNIYDGLKPVQRRILHSMWELEDGRYNKVANIVGNTMKYHPHGDASINDALVNLGQKELLIDCQGNWGNTLTGDGAAAGRYIEARLSKFANEVVFNPKTTQWKLSYDGRNKEPITLPIKFPLLLAQGVEGIGVGLASKILPHNFNELIDASIAILEKKDFTIYPDFPTGGYVDISNYNDGERGGSVRVRAKIIQEDKRTLVIKEIPFETTTQTLIDSISKVTEKGRIRINKIFDKTSSEAEIVLQLAPNTSPDQTIDALYAFTLCQKSISPNCCVIIDNKPHFVDVKKILTISTNNTLNLLKLELEILLSELNEKWHWISLEKIFFEKKIYKELEKDQDSFESQIDDIEKAFDPYRSHFKREITREDVLKLTEKPVKKISKFDIKEAEQQIENIEIDIDEVNNNLNHIVEYTIQYFRQIKKKYGLGKERRTEIRNFDTIAVADVAVANQKLYMNRKEGFIGTSLRKDEYVCDCSDVDEIIVFRENGTFMVTKVAEKSFVGENILYADVFSRNDDRTIYNVVYCNGALGPNYVKRFAIGGITRDKEYDITQGKKNSKILYFTANKNGEAEVIKVFLKHKPKLKKLQFDFDFSTLAIRGRNTIGNILSKNPIRRIEMIEKGTSTLDALNIWYDESVNKLNTDKRGIDLGDFDAEDKIIAFYKTGYYKIHSFDISTHFDDDLIHIEKLDIDKPITVIYHDKAQNKYFIRRSLPKVSDKKTDLLNGNTKASLHYLSLDYLPQVEVISKNKNEKQSTIIQVADYVQVMNMKARGKRIAIDNIVSLKKMEALPYTPPEKESKKTDSENELIEEENNVTPAEPSNMEKEQGTQMTLF